MSVQKQSRPAFMAVELDDPIDDRLEARAAEKGIPKLVSLKIEPAPSSHETLSRVAAAAVSKPFRAASPAQSTPRLRMKTAKVELPDYVWVALKKRAAEDMVSLRYLIMSALRAQGFAINEADMIEDGRRLR